MIKYIYFFDKYSFVFSFAYTLLVAICGFVISKLIPKIKQYKIRKCLSLSKYECKIVLPCYNKKLHNKNDLIQVCPVGDIKAVSNIIDLIHTTGLYSHQQSIIYENDYFSNFENYNIFCIGGSLSNQYTYDIFQQFFPKFKIYACKDKIENNPNKIPYSHFILNEFEKGFCWGNLPDEKFIINNDERYAIIVKLSNEDFNIKNHGTIHILFGNGVEGTLAISKYLLNNYKDLYSRVGRKSHYFIAFKLRKTTGIIDTKSFIDLTEKMFNDIQ